MPVLIIVMYSGHTEPLDEVRCHHGLMMKRRIYITTNTFLSKKLYYEQ